jgi:hypothetical protein
MNKLKNMIAQREHFVGAFKQFLPVRRLSHGHRDGLHKKYRTKKTGKTWLLSLCYKYTI